MGHPQLDLTNKTAVVIGGGSGIGLALSKGLAQAGANVVPTGRRKDLVSAAVEQVKAPWESARWSSHAIPRTRSNLSACGTSC